MSGIPAQLRQRMEAQGYHFVGRHSAVKICKYAANGLRGDALCYKHAFYGIRSWRCMQATPAIGCDLACRFCWRIMPEELGLHWNELNSFGSWDDPEGIAEGMIREQRRVVSGHKAVADTELKMRRWKESNSPMHVAISLTGEPTFYPGLGKLLEAFHRRGISTFLVSNGTLPDALAQLGTLPTQLYVSLQAPDERSHAEIARPKVRGSWERHLRTLSMLGAMKTRTALRMTLIKGLNMHNAEGYARLIRMANANYVEVKGFSFVGSSRGKQRGLSHESMPSHGEVKAFAALLAEKTGYMETAEHRASRAVLLSRDKDSESGRMINFGSIGKEG